MNVKKLNYQQQLPFIFNSWMEFYNKCLEDGLDLSSGEVIKFNYQKDPFTIIEYIYEPNAIKAKCFEELMKLKIDKNTFDLGIKTIYHFQYFDQSDWRQKLKNLIIAFKS